MRTWLYYTLLRCYLLTGKAPFKDAWVGGLGQDAQGRAMRKSLGNVVDPEPLFEKYRRGCVQVLGRLGGRAGFRLQVQRGQDCRRRQVADEALEHGAGSSARSRSRRPQSSHGPTSGC